MLDIIEKIDAILFDNAMKMKVISIQGDLSAIIFEATRCNYAKDSKYKERAKVLIDKSLAAFPESDFGPGFIDGFEGIFWTIHYAATCGVLDSDKTLIDIEPYLFASLKRDIEQNHFDLLYGSMGKMLYYLESDSHAEKRASLVDGFIAALYENRTETEQGIFWFDTEEGAGLVNLGIAHGVTAVLIFLLRLKEKGHAHTYLDKLINGILKSLISFRNKAVCSSAYPAFYATLKDDKRRMDSRLAWCTGDLGVTHALLYAGEILKRRDVMERAHEILGKLVARGISDSGLDHFEEYGFFDTGFCHGISGILFMWMQIKARIKKSPVVEKRVLYWKTELIRNLKIQLKIDGKIYLPWYKQNADNSYTLDNESMLNGLCGVGLVLLSLHYERSDWSDMLLLH
ncbi:MAG: lanthionine synthetase LanC family protein [Flavobacteriales bacterium]